MSGLLLFALYVTKFLYAQCQLFRLPFVVLRAVLPLSLIEHLRTNHQMRVLHCGVGRDRAQSLARERLTVRVSAHGGLPLPPRQRGAGLRGLEKDDGGAGQ